MYSLYPHGFNILSKLLVGTVGDNISMHMKLLGKGVGGRGERYTCTLCGEQGSKTVVTLHLHENHMDTLNQCKTCGKRFNGAGHLRKTKQKLTLCLKDFFQFIIFLTYF